MNTLIKLLFLFAMITFMGCGGGDGDSSSTDTPTTSSERVLVLNESTEVFDGEVYEAKSLDAETDVEHNTITNQRYITLIKGEGVIIKVE